MAQCCCLAPQPWTPVAGPPLLAERQDIFQLDKPTAPWELTQILTWWRSGCYSTALHNMKSWSATFFFFLWCHESCSLSWSQYSPPYYIFSCTILWHLLLSRPDPSLLSFPIAVIFPSQQAISLHHLPCKLPHGPSPLSPLVGLAF